MLNQIKAALGIPRVESEPKGLGISQPISIIPPFSVDQQVRLCLRKGRDLLRIGSERSTADSRFDEQLFVANDRNGSVRANASLVKRLSVVRVWIGVDAGPPSIQVYAYELATETGPMPGSPSAPIRTPPLGRFIKRNQFSKPGPGRVPFQRLSTGNVRLPGCCR
jgi:hypothetical protein